MRNFITILALAASIAPASADGIWSSHEWQDSSGGYHVQTTYSHGGFVGNAINSVDQHHVDALPNPCGSAFRELTGPDRGSCKGKF